MERYQTVSPQRKGNKVFTPNIENMQMPMPVLKCPACGNDMTLRTKKDNAGFFIGCTGFPNCKMAVWLPGSVMNTKVMDETCEFCGPNTRLLDFKFRANRVPPTVPLEYTGCVGGCDDMLINDVGIRPPRSTSSGRSDGTVTNSINTSTVNNQSGNKRNMSTVATAGVDRAIVTPIYVHSSNDRNNRQNQSDQWNDNNFRSSSPRQNQSNTYSQNRGDNNRVPLRAANGNVQNKKTGDTNNIVCNCGNDAVQLTVRKEGPNTGRQFYKCGGSSCSFFLWADETDNHRLTRNNAGFTQDNGRYQKDFGKTGKNHHTQHSTQNTSGGDVCCNCGNPAKQLKVQKEGPNKGRQFFACPAPRGEGCNFFQWGDESIGGGGFVGGGKGRGTTQDGRKRQASSEGGGPVKKGKKCGLCGVEGHTKRTCPHK